MAWAYNDPRWLKVNKAFVVLMSLLFTASVLAWRGVPVFGSEPPNRPLGSVFMSAALLLQALGAVARRRSYVLFYVLLGSSLVALWFSFTAR